MCAPGYGEKGGQCVRGAPSASVVAAAAGETTQTNKPRPIVRDLVLLQNCLKEAGYLKGPVGKKVTRAGWSAFWYFKRDHKVGRTPNGMYNKRAQKKLFALCPKVLETALKGGDENKDGTGKGAQAGASVQATTTPTSFAKPEVGCLPSDLFALIRRTYGKRENLKRCTQTCVPIPKGLTKAEIADYEKKRGVRWCKSCIELVSHLPLDDILRIERGAKVQICTRPPTQLPRWSHPAQRARKAYTKVREIYRAYKRKTKHEKDIAVIIGNRSYKGELPVHETAHNNAGAMYALLSEHLGFGQANIIDLRDATKRDLQDLFGRGEKRQGDLWRRLQKEPGARVLIYYAGHATTNANQSESYLLPVDAIKHREAQSGYAMSELYKSLRLLGASSVTLMLEASFGRDVSAFVFPPNLPEMWVKSLPSSAIRGLTVMTAADRDQKVLDDPHYSIGLFTRYLIEGLAGQADIAPIGNGDGRIETVELYAFTARMVRLTARKSYGLLQRPVLSQKKNLVVSSMRAKVQR